MTSPTGWGRPAVDLDADLARQVRRTAWMRQGFYVVVLLVALAGQVSGAVEALHIPLLAAIPAVGALELGGIVVLANADVRRRLGERAVASRVLSAVIAAGAVAFNWLAHADHLLGGFFAGMSALGYLVWLMHTENQRRDRLRATGDLAWTTPAYEVVGHWLAHPWLTRRARALAKADPSLGLYDSLAASRAQVRRERRQAAIAKVLHRKIRAAVDSTTAAIAVQTYDLDEVAARLAGGADYDGLTALIAADLEPSLLAAGKPVEVAREVASAVLAEPPADAMTLAELTGPREVAGDVALPAVLPLAITTGPVAVEVAHGTADDAVQAGPRAAAAPVADRVLELAALVASGRRPKPGEVARILGTDNVPHVSRTLRKAQEGVGVTRPETPPPPPRPSRQKREEQRADDSNVNAGPQAAAGGAEGDTRQQEARSEVGRLADGPAGRGPATAQE